MPLTAKQALYQLINTANGTDFTAVNTQLSAPTTNDNPTVSSRNTKVVLSAVPNKGYTGAVTLYYNRTPITTITGSGTVDLDWGNERYISELIPKLNTQFNQAFVPEDFVEAVLPDDEEGVVTFAMVVSSGSYGWTGFFNLRLTKIGPDLSSVVETTEL